MSKHLHQRTSYCISCETVADHKCCNCDLPICQECYQRYNGLCDICASVKSADTDYKIWLGENYDYGRIEENNYLLDV